MPTPNPTPRPADDAPPAGDPLPWPRNDERLDPFLPMVYVAWSDGILSPGEMARIREEIREVDRLDEVRCRILESWLRPETPPSPIALARLRERIREVADRISPTERRSLASLGVAMARLRTGDDGGWASAEGMRILEGVEEILGVLGREAARELVAGEGGPAPEPESPPFRFRVAALRRILEGAHGPLRRRILELLEDPGIRVPDGLPTSEARAATLAALRRLTAEGVGTLGFPREAGGGNDPAAAIAAFETLAFGNLSVLVKFGVHFGLFGGSVIQLGTERHHRAYLPRIASLELPGIFAMTERDHGSNVRELETVARYLPDADAFEIHTPHPGARKDWLGNAALHGRIATVFAQLEVGGEGHGVHAFLVPVRDAEGRVLEGIRVEDCGEKLGLHGVDNGRLAFDRVRIPRDGLLNRFGEVTPEGEYRSPIASPGRRFFTMLGTLVAGRISIAAASVSGAKTGLTIAVRYSDRRTQFGPSGAPEVPLLDYTTQQRALLPALATTYALHFAVEALVRNYEATSGDDGTDSRVEVLAAGFKAYASRHAMDTIQACREAMGGRGYLAANRLGTLRDDMDVFTTFEGANVVLLQLVARGLLSDYRDELGDLRFWGMVRLLGERAATGVARRSPVRLRQSGEEHLRNPEAQLDALRFREARLLQSAGRRLKRRLDRGMDSFHAMNECQDHLVSLGEAHVERVVLERFRAAVDAAREAGEGPASVLDALATLYALSRLERDRAWFLEAGFMDGGQTREVRTQVNRLCRELRTSATALVDAFGIPDAVLAAPDAVGRARRGG